MPGKTVPDAGFSPAHTRLLAVRHALASAAALAAAVTSLGSANGVPSADAKTVLPECGGKTSQYRSISGLSC